MTANKPLIKRAGDLNSKPKILKINKTKLMKQLLLCTAGGMPTAQKPVVTVRPHFFYRACVLDMERSHLPPNSTVPLCARRGQSR